MPKKKRRHNKGAAQQAVQAQQRSTMKSKAWDQYECALLLDAYLRVQNGAPRRQTVKDLSEALRRRAMNIGLSIDPVFRNTNGVSLQMSNLEYVVTSGKKGVKCKTKAFYSICQLREDDPAEYQRVLGKARLMVHGQVQPAPDDDLLEMKAIEQGIEYSDKRAKGGCFWIIGGDELAPFVEECARAGVRFSKKAEGANATNGKPGWWTRGTLKQTASTCIAVNSLNDALSLADCVAAHFPYGIAVDSLIQMARFKSFYETDTGATCELSDEEITKKLCAECLEFEGKLFYVTNDIAKEVTERIDAVVSEGFRIVYWQKLYDEDVQWFLDRRIVSWEMLRAFISARMKSASVKKQYFLAHAVSGTEIEVIKHEILRIWGTPTLRSFDDLEMLLPYVPIDKIKLVLTTQDDFVWNSKETYTRLVSFSISDKEIPLLTTEIERVISEDGHAELNDLPIDELRCDNPDFSDIAFCELLIRKLSNDYSRHGTAIVKNQASSDLNEAIATYCAQADECTFAELCELAFSLVGSNRYPAVVEAANSVMVRVSSDLFVKDESVHFDIEAIDRCIDSVMVGDVIGLKEIVVFAAYPSCGYSWNPFLLESFVRRFSCAFKYDALTQNSDNCGAIIRKHFSGDYHEAMARRLAESNISLEKKAVYDYLISAGLLARRRYGRIEPLIELAKQMRKDG